MLSRFFNKNKKPQTPAENLSPVKRRGSVFSTDESLLNIEKVNKITAVSNLRTAILKATKNLSVYDDSGARGKFAMDSACGDDVMPILDAFRNASSTGAGMPDVQVAWYAAQTFITHQLCAVLMQHWLIDKACTMPARDAMRLGWDVKIIDQESMKGVDSKQVLDAIRRADKRFRMKKQCQELIRFSRGFGIRVAMFLVDSTDPEYYEKPFNPDGITPDSYKGIVQIDPYWIMPQMSVDSSSDPMNPHFYEPTWWQIGTQRVHHTHLIIVRPNEVADILKPAYLFGGISVPQKIYERVYSSERTANEAPMLAMTKRSTTLTTDVMQALANITELTQRMNAWVALRDNYGVKMIDTEEKIEQFDTSLADLDNVIMTQFQLVAGASDTPATKLLGTQPKGFNTTGEYEESSYHETLESIQENDVTPFLERHYLCLIRSEIAPKFAIKPFQVDIAWAPLDSLTAEQQATVNLTKAQTGYQLVLSGAINAAEERQRIMADPDSGYNNLTAPTIEGEGQEEEDPEDGEPLDLVAEAENLKKAKAQEGEKV